MNANKVHLLEIDLLRSGKRPSLPQPVPTATYYIILSRAQTDPHLSVWPIQLQESLPSIPVPLRSPTPDVMLDLESAMTTIYDKGAYDIQLNYRQEPPLPKLSEKQSIWVQQLLHEYRRLA